MLIEPHILPRNDIPIKNKFTINEYSTPDDFHIVIYYINDNTCKIIVRRIDSEDGWDITLTIKIHSTDTTTFSEVIIGPSKTNDKIVQINTSINLEPVDLNYTQKIPKVIIQTDETNDLVLLKYNSVMSLIELNPEYEYIFYDKKARRRLIKENFEDVLDAYDTLVPGAYRADLFRYCYLYLYGGCYFDCKIILKKSLREWIGQDESIVFINDATPKAFANGIMMMEKGNKLLLNCINKIKQHVKEQTYRVDKLFITGPQLLYSFFDTHKSNFYFKKLNNDWCNNYKNSIIVNNNNELFCYVYYAGYYKNYSNTNHYSTLYNKRLVYFKNKILCGKYTIYVFPHFWPDTYEFVINSNKIIVQRIDNDREWGGYLIIKVINRETHDEQFITVGSSKINPKIINF